MGKWRQRCIRRGQDDSNKLDLELIGPVIAELRRPKYFVQMNGQKQCRNSPFPSKMTETMAKNLKLCKPSFNHTLVTCRATRIICSKYCCCWTERDCVFHPMNYDRGYVCLVLALLCCWDPLFLETHSSTDAVAGILLLIVCWYIVEVTFQTMIFKRAPIKHLHLHVTANHMYVWRRTTYTPPKQWKTRQHIYQKL